MHDADLLASLPPGDDEAVVEVPGVGIVRRREQDCGALGTHLTWGEVVLDTPDGWQRCLRAKQRVKMPDARLPDLRREFETTGRIRQRNAANRLPAEAVAAPQEWLAEQERRAEIVTRLGWHHTGWCWERK